MSELQQFISMIKRSGIAHGFRDDRDPFTRVVIVEIPQSYEPMDAEFLFDVDGNLVTISCYPAEEDAQ
jgi:hypothetical protein